GEDELEVAYIRDRSGAHADGDLAEVVRVGQVRPDAVDLEVRGVRHTFSVARYEVVGSDTVVEVDSPLGPVPLIEPPRYSDPGAEVAAGSLLAPMPGAVIRVAVSVGDTVTAGQPLLWMEAMKMEHTISAAVDGIVTELPVEVGTQVETGTILAVVAEPDSTDADSTDPSSTDTTTPQE
ncbi:MAG: biotin/lipoyl-containing protein, partial [Dietzia cercidiphylli]